MEKFLKKVLFILIGGMLLIIVCYIAYLGVKKTLLREAVAYKPPISYESADISIKQIDDRIFVSLPNSSVTIEMVHIPAGKFSMGGIDEEPIHDVYLDEYWIDLTEVTNEQFKTFVQETGYKTIAEMEGMSSVVFNALGVVEGANWRFPQGPGHVIDNWAQHPVVQVSWDDASSYCLWRGARLPTEAEWEKAARGTNTNIFPWGNEIHGSELNFCDTNCSFHQKLMDSDDDGYATTALVTSFESGRSPYGIFNMAGNVMEYTADWYTPNYYGNSPENNPLGPNPEDIIAQLKVVRGGSWLSIHPNDFTTYRRNTTAIDNRSDDKGFRCVYPSSKVNE